MAKRPQPALSTSPARSVGPLSTYSSGNDSPAVCCIRTCGCPGRGGALTRTLWSFVINQHSIDNILVISHLAAATGEAQASDHHPVRGAR